MYIFKTFCILFHRIVEKSYYMEKVKLADVFNYLLKDRHKYKAISVKDKTDNFFIINRLLSKKYPEQAQKFNKKSIDKSLALDLWFLFLRHEKRNEIFKWIWSKSPKSDKLLSESDCKLLIKKLEISVDDLDILMMYHIDFLKDELNYFKQLNKQK